MMLVLALLAVSGCDRQKPQPQQGEATATRPAAAKSGIDRSHSGQAMPQAVFRDPDGEEVALKEFVGRPLLLNLWASWCAPCIKELPTLDALAVEAGAPRVLTVSQDMAPQGSVVAFLETHKLARLEAWHDPEMALSGELGAQILPTTILYDADGKEVWRYVGDLDWQSTKAKALLGEAETDSNRAAVR